MLDNIASNTSVLVGKAQEPVDRWLTLSDCEQLPLLCSYDHLRLTQGVALRRRIFRKFSAWMACQKVLAMDGLS